MMRLLLTPGSIRLEWPRCMQNQARQIEPVTSIEKRTEWLKAFRSPPGILLHGTKNTTATAQSLGDHQLISRVLSEPQVCGVERDISTGKLPHALKDAVMAPDIASNIYRVISRVLPRSRPSCRQHDASNYTPNNNRCDQMSKSREARFTANGIIQGHEFHAGTTRSPALNRDLVVSSASLPSPCALVLRAAVYRKQHAIGSVQYPCLLVSYWVCKAGKHMMC